MSKLCSAEDCRRKAYRRGMCNKHYLQWLNPPPKPCSIEDCSNKAHARGWCNKHYLRWQSHGDPNIVKPQVPPPVKRGTENGNWRGDDVKYVSLHARLRRERGNASEHQCFDCGKPADGWAYDKTDPDEITDPETGYPYSLDFDRYRPLCYSCHWYLDRTACTRASSQVTIARL